MAPERIGVSGIFTDLSDPMPQAVRDTMHRHDRMDNIHFRWTDGQGNFEYSCMCRFASVGTLAGIGKLLDPDY